jgi:hypothetical protein
MRARCVIALVALSLCPVGGFAAGADPLAAVKAAGATLYTDDRLPGKPVTWV